MNFIEIAQSRQSCRNFDPLRPLEKVKLDICLEAARLAPSACNSQPWQFTLCNGLPASQDSGGMSAAVAKCMQGAGMNKFTNDVPAFVIVSKDSYNASAAIGSIIKNQDYRSVDIGIASAYLTSEAAAQGLASCILGWFDEKKLKALTGIKTKICLVIALGYAKAEDKLRHKLRKPLNQVVRWI